MICFLFLAKHVNSCFSQHCFRQDVASSSLDKNPWVPDHHNHPCLCQDSSHDQDIPADAAWPIQLIVCGNT